MHVVLGASGNTGHIVASTLLDRGQKVRVVSRNPAHLQPFAQRGAETFIADVTDSAALIQAFQQAESAYVMIPPNSTSKDPLGYSNRVVEAISGAIQSAGTKNVVALSSIGADKPSGTGPVAGLHHLEQKLSQISHANVLFLRAGYFMENTLPQADAIRKMGFAVGPLRPDLKVPMIATRDIGTVAAQALLQPSVHGKQTVELLGHSDLSYNDVVRVIGQAIGKNDLKYVQLPDNQILPALVQMGMSEEFARLLLEMTGALNSGYMHALEPRTARNTTPTSYETFVAESFVPAYHHQPAAA